MSAEATSDVEGEAPYPSFEERREQGHRFSCVPEACRIYWPLEGTFPSNIAYMNPMGKLNRMRNLEDLEPLYQPETDTWHEIASMPFTTMKVSSIRLSLRELHDWEWRWIGFHRECGEEQKEYVTCGDLDDEDRPYRSEADEDGNWEVDSDTEFLIKCCGKDRPLKKKGRSLTITPAEGNTFVTIRDYLGTVHAWLMNMRDDVIQGSEYVHWSGEDDTEWMVDHIMGYDLSIKSKKAWVNRHGPMSPAQEASSARIFERIKRERAAEREAEKAAKQPKMAEEQTVAEQQKATESTAEQKSAEEQKESQDSVVLVSSTSVNL
ncbi:hypothetical protein NLG97_g8067 [Lecanicillium saksenae]|uniref:Uncharacterized protein n=1 Tax=Lecanicillium saksenae TaxID=468837 RepID=A0ACC1QLC2_9HYPO|nr:hypothetical protein NLG97_g8067 [Lecanicillium saksenae]